MPVTASSARRRACEIIPGPSPADEVGPDARRADDGITGLVMSRRRNDSDGPRSTGWRREGIVSQALRLRRHLAALTACVSALAAPQALAAKTKTTTTARPASHALSIRRGPHVIYLTAHTAYVGLGSEDGIAVGMSLSLRR